MITASAIKQAIANVVDPLRARVAGVVRRAVLRTFDNGPGMATGAFAITDDDIDVADEVEVINPIGVSFRPGKGVEAILLAVGGNPAHRVAIPFARGKRLTGDDIVEGEVALHIGIDGQVVHLKQDGSVEVRAKKVGGSSGGSIVLKANGDVVVVPSAAGNVFLGKDGAAKKVALADDVDARLTAIQAKFDAHVHPGVTAGPGSTAVTATPIGVLAPTGADNVYGKG